MSQVAGDVTGEQFMQQFLRELPDITAPELAEQDVFRNFETLLESVIEQQAVPLENRNLVREYFLRMSEGQ